jgi:hypothetical protein
MADQLTAWRRRPVLSNQHLSSREAQMDRHMFGRVNFMEPYELKGVADVAAFIPGRVAYASAVRSLLARDGNTGV